MVEDWDLAGAGVAAARSLGSFLGSTFWTEDAAGEAGGAGRTGRAFHSFSRILFDKDEWFAKGAQNEGVHTHLESVCILGDLAPFLVVVQRIEEDEVEVLERVKRVFVLVLREIRLDPIDAARLGNNLPGPQFERLCLDRGMIGKTTDLVIFRPGIPVHELEEHVGQPPLCAAASRAGKRTDDLVDGGLLRCADRHGGEEDEQEMDATVAGEQ